LWKYNKLTTEAAGCCEVCPWGMSAVKLYLNSCRIEEIEEVNSWGFLGGVTMNPTMVAKVPMDYRKNMRDICALMPDRPVFAQVVAETPENILEEGKALAAIAENIVVKVQTSYAGTAGMRLLKEAGIPVCATSVHSVIEAVVVGSIGVDHVAVFVGLLGEVSEQPVAKLLHDIAAVYRGNGVPTKVMTAARSVGQLVEGYASGADESTCSYQIFTQLLDNPYTRQRWEAFRGDWKGTYGSRDWITG